MPGGQEVRVLLVQFVLEPAECAATVDRPRESPTGAVVADLLDKVGHVLIPDMGGQRIDSDQVQLVEINRIAPVNPEVAGPEHDLTSLRVHQPPPIIRILILQRGRNLVQIETLQVKHQPRILRHPTSGPLAKTAQYCPNTFAGQSRPTGASMVRMSLTWYASPAARGWRCAAPSESPLAFHAALPDYQPTPLVDSPSLADELGVA